VDSNRGKKLEYVKIDLTQADRLIKEMAQGFYSVFMGEIDMAGCVSMGNYDYIHPVKATALSLLIGKEAGYAKADLVKLGMASLLQNIGYIMVPKNVLAGLDPSSEDASPQFRKHPELGRQIVLQSGDVDANVTEAIVQHHERWDGSGYPKGLKGEEISRYARIMAIAGTYHELVSQRPKQQPFSPPEAAEYVAAYSGELFDPELAQIFFRSIPFYSKGRTVKLSDGEVGIVVDANVGHIGRPLVRICYDRYEEEVETPYDIDLSSPEYQNRMIVQILDY